MADSAIQGVGHRFSELVSPESQHFGCSCGRIIGSATVSSADLDLIVVCRDPARLKAKPPIEVDLRAYTGSDLDALISRGHDMLGWAVNFGRLLFQRESFWDAVLRKWKQHLPFPSAETAGRRANDAFRHMINVFESGDLDAAHEQALSYVTHLARAELLRRRVYPTSRPELPKQLRAVACPGLAASLESLLDPGDDSEEEVIRLIEGGRLSGG
jgi:hypothetical protein